MYIMLNSTKKDGNTSLSYGTKDEVLNNRRNFFKKHNIDIKNTLVLRTLNENKIVEITKEFRDSNKDLSKIILEADGIVTKEKNIFFYLNFGDCIALSIYDKRKDVLMLCHLGWHSVKNNLHIIAINYLKEKYNSNVEDLIVELGPSIKKDSYIMESPIQLGDDAWIKYIEKIDDKNYKVDLNSYVVDGLKNIGIKDIKVSEIDTYSNSNYYSNYEENKFNLDKGRFIVGAMLK